jgi:tetratricopeptide (TPR) repeat protein
MNRDQHPAGESGQASSEPATENAAKAAATSAAELLAQGLRCQQSGRLAEAENCYRRLLAAQPGHADALHLLGLAAHQSGRHGAAIELIGEAIKRDAQNPIYFSNLGIALKYQGRLDQAVAAYREAIRLKPDYPDALYNCANALKDLKRYDEALASYDATLSLRPDYAAAVHNRAIVLVELERIGEALASFERALALKPDYAEAFFNRGLALQQLGRLDEALASYDQALALRPGDAATLNNRGRTLLKLARLEEALASYDRALALEPGSLDAHNGRSAVLLKLKRPDAALANCDQTLVLQGNDADAHNSRGIALQDLKRFDEALASYDRALALKSGFAEAIYNKGLALQELKRLDEALAHFDRAAALRPGFADAHGHGALLRLLTGDFARGWTESEWRWKSPSSGLVAPNYPQPRWHGEQAIDGKTILLHSEQGYGDTIQFCRYVPLVAARGARVILQVEEPLRQLMSGLSGVSQCISKSEPLPDFDLHCPLLSLPLAFATRLQTIPSARSYLRVPAEAKNWAAELGPRGRPRIGVAWSGNPQHQRDAERSIAFAALSPLLAVPAIFVSLQRDVRAGDRPALAAQGGILDLAASFENFTDAAALVAALDLVITVDTSVAHLAAALGRPVWTLLPFVPDWRWLLDRDDSPWYPTMRLFRQSARGVWGDVIARVAAALRHAVDSGAVGGDG